MKRRKKIRKEAGSHVGAEELLDGFRLHALDEFGPMSLMVLNYWGVRTSEDVGNLVFNLVAAGVFGKTDEDTIESFREIFDFEEVFVEPFRRLGVSCDNRSPSQSCSAQHLPSEVGQASACHASTCPTRPGVAPTISPDVRYGPPGLHSLGSACAGGSASAWPSIAPLDRPRLVGPNRAAANPTHRRGCGCASAGYFRDVMKASSSLRLARPMR